MSINTETAEQRQALLVDAGSWARLAAVAAAFAVLYYGAFVSLASAWWENDAYSHGFFVPLISLYLVWERRKRLASAPARPALAAGILAVVLSALVHIAGVVMSVSLVSEVSLVAMLASLVLLVGGWSRLGVLAFPVSYLLFMVPFLRGVTDRVYWPFQLFAAKAGTAMMELMGIPVLLERQYIELPNVMLEVAVECSGIHYLISIVAIGVPLAGEHPRAREQDTPRHNAFRRPGHNIRRHRPRGRRGRGRGRDRDRGPRPQTGPRGPGQEAHHQGPHQVRGQREQGRRGPGPYKADAPPPYQEIRHHKIKQERQKNRR